ncbi:MAG: hypothetical protein CNIPEHKO_00151 [Anaerolineales bacterium]|nr:hypothetical protein [Anaerolineales bacterium]
MAPRERKQVTRHQKQDHKDVDTTKEIQGKSKAQSKDISSSKKTKWSTEQIILQSIITLGTVIVAAIGALAAIQSAKISSQSQLDQSKIQIETLKAQIAQRDAQIESLNNEITSLKNPLQGILARDGNAEFEWQWAGENWYGRVAIQQQGNTNAIIQAQVGLLEKKLDDSISIDGQVFNLLPNTGNFNITDDGVIHLQFSAKKKDRRFGTVHTVIITADLQQALCYVGKVNDRNTDTNEQYRGDMILVSPITTLDTSVEAWFSANIDQPWFERYIVDR